VLNWISIVFIYLSADYEKHLSWCVDKWANPTGYKIKQRKSIAKHPFSEAPSWRHRYLLQCCCRCKSPDTAAEWLRCAGDARVYDSWSSFIKRSVLNDLVNRSADNVAKWTLDYGGVYWDALAGRNSGPA